MYCILSVLCAGSTREMLQRNFVNLVFRELFLNKDFDFNYQIKGSRDILQKMLLKLLTICFPYFERVCELYAEFLSYFVFRKLLRRIF